MTVDLSSSTSGSNDLVAITGNLTVNGNNISVYPINGTLADGTYTIMTYTGSLIGTFGTAATISPSHYSITISTTTAHEVQLTVTGGPASLTWNNGTGNSFWDVASSYNWTNFAAVAEEQFYASDSVTFDNTIITAANPSTAISLASGTSVFPNGITVNSTTNYSFSGAGVIAGATGLLKEGSSTLVIATTNTFTGAVTISGGTLQAQNASALGAATGTVTITNGATLDLDGSYITSKSYLVSGAGIGGNGAIINSGGSIFENSPQGVTNITLQGNATLGGPSRWDMGSAAGGSLSTGGNPYSLTLTNTSAGTYTWEWLNVTVDPALSNINLGGATLGLKLGNGATLGNAAGTFTVYPGAQLDFWSGTGYAKNYHIMNNATNQVNTNASFNQTLSLDAGSCYSSGNIVTNLSAVTLNGLANFNITGGDSIFASAIGGVGGVNLVAGGSHPLVLVAANTYVGSTLLAVSGAELELLSGGSISDSTNINMATGSVLISSTRTDATLTLASGQTLQGTGTIDGDLSTTSGSTVIPGTNGTGTMTVTNIVTLAGTTAMGVGVGSNNLLTCATIGYGGTLSLSFIPGSLSAGNSFKLFNASSASYTGSFASITPATPGAGLAWGTSLLNTSGTLTVVTAASPATFGPPTLSGTTLTLSGSGGADNGTYHIYSSTNVIPADPLSAWTLVGTNSFSGTGTFSFPITISPTTPATFYIIVAP